MPMSFNQYSATPRKAISSRQYSHETSTSSISQGELIDIMKHEIGNHAWVYPPAQVVKMLSPKCPKRLDTDSGSYPSLDDFEFLIEQPAVIRAMEAMPPPFKPKFYPRETDNYPEIVQFLNSCFDHCDDAYNVIHAADASGKGPFSVASIDERWVPTIRLNPYDKPTRDGVDGASALKPDVVGVKTSKQIPREVLFCYWSLPWEDTDVYEVEKDFWPGLVAQAATYARAQGSSIPLRAFSVVIGVNHVDKSLRFLIFHRGGLTASSPLNLTKQADRLEAQTVMLSILLWQSPQDAGIPSFTDGMTFLLPSSQSTPARTAVLKVLHHALSVCGRNTWVARLEAAHEMQHQQPQSGEPATPATLAADTTADTITVRKSKCLMADPKKGASTLPPKSLPAARRRPRRKRVSPDPDEVPFTRIKTKPFYTNAAKPFFVPPRRILPQQHDTCDQKNRVVVVKCSWPTKAKREVEPKLYQACSGQFGNPLHLFSFEASYIPGFLMSNSIFLPRLGADPVDGDVWRIWGGVHSHKPDVPDYRSLWVTVLGDEGSRLECCTEAWDLCECLLHTILGWLVLYQNGYLHRDVSIGNLLKLLLPKTCDPFTTKGVLKLLKDLLKVDSASLADAIVSLTLDDLRPADDEELWNRLKEITRNDQDLAELVDIAYKLEHAVADYGISTECKAIICDGDMAAYMPKYFEDHKYGGDISGTPEFMSRALRNALEYNHTYLQSPVDDMYSFFWVAYWAILHPSGSQTKREIRLRTLIEGERRQDAVQELIDVARDPECSPLLRTMTPLLRDWHASLDLLYEEFEAKRPREGQSGLDPRQYRLLFHQFAYRGVAGFVALLAKHCKVREATPGPASST